MAPYEPFKNASTKTPEAKPHKSVPISLEKMSESVDKVAVLTDQVGSIYAAVRSGKSSADENPGDRPQAPCQLADKLDAIRERLEHIATMLSMYIEQCEL